MGSVPYIRLKQWGGLTFNIAILCIIEHTNWYKAVHDIVAYALCARSCAMIFAAYS